MQKTFPAIFNTEILGVCVGRNERCTRCVDRRAHKVARYGDVISIYDALCRKEDANISNQITLDSIS
jgi:hypothetical protein